MIVDFTPTPVFYIIIGAILGMVIGWVIGFFDSNKRTEKKINEAEARAHAKILEAEEKSKKAEADIARAEQAGSGGVVDTGLLRIRAENGRTLVEVDGTPLGGTVSADRKKRLIEVIALLRPWLEGGSPQQPAAPQPKPAPAPVREQASAPLQPAKKPEPEKDFASMSIVQQIDTILQSRLVDTPLEDKGIRLQESPEGAVEVTVGLKKFFSIDDVTDDKIRAAIRAAISEWEEKYTPGL